jgi:ABC-2 type transport system permease protein
VGLCFSAATRNQMVAWLVSSVLLLVFNLTGLAATTADIHPMLASALVASDLSYHFHAMGRGVLDVRDLLYFFSLTVVCLCWNGLLLERKAKG